MIREVDLDLSTEQNYLFVQNVLAIDPKVVEMFQSGPKWWTGQAKEIAI